MDLWSSVLFTMIYSQDSLQNLDIQYPIFRISIRICELQLFDKLPMYLTNEKFTNVHILKI